MSVEKEAGRVRVVQPDIRVGFIVNGRMAQPLASNGQHLLVGSTLVEDGSRKDTRGANNSKGTKSEKEPHTHFGLERQN